MRSHGPQNVEGTEVREQAGEYAPIIFAHDAYKHVISFDLLSGAVSTRSSLSPSLPLQFLIFFTKQTHSR
jgi:hypothetical protein